MGRRNLVAQLTAAGGFAAQTHSSRATHQPPDNPRGSVALALFDTQESNLPDLAIDDTGPKGWIRAMLREIGATRERLTAQLEAAVGTLTDAVEFIGANLRMLENPYELYLHASDEVRRRLNRAIVTRVFIDHEEVTGHRLEDLLTV